VAVPLRHGRIVQGTHLASFEEARRAFGEGQRAQVLNAAELLAHRLTNVVGGQVEVLLGGPVTDLRFTGLIPFARLGTMVPDQPTLERALIDDAVLSLLSVHNVQFEFPVPRSGIRDHHPVGGLVQSVLVTTRGRQHLEYWAGRVVDQWGVELPSGATAGVLEVKL
jgi:hypothetical protein